MTRQNISIIGLSVVAALLAIILTINLTNPAMISKGSTSLIPENDHSKVIATTDNDNSTCLYDQLKTQGLKVIDVSGSSILKETNTGKEVLIAANVSNDCKVSDYPVKELIEVRDSSGTTSFLVYMNTTVNSNQPLTFGALWKPDKSGDYIIRASTIHCPSCLSYPPIATYNITVRD